MLKQKYPDDYDPITEYWKSFVQNGGKTVVSKKIYKTYRKIIADLNSKDSDYYYSNLRGNHIIEFIENFCRHSKGKYGGKPVILELWEKAMLATVFGFVDSNGYRKYQRAVLIIGKKNGKSLLASCVGLYMLLADNESGPEIYSVATKKEQAKIIWEESKRMVNKSPALRKRIKPTINQLSSENFNNGTFKALASDTNSLDGLNVHCALMDEIHQWRNGEALYNIIADGVTARDQPLIFITSTAGVIREDIYDHIYDEATMTINGYEQEAGYEDERSIFFIYELDKKEEWRDKSNWIKANPGLGTIKNIKTLAEKVAKARQNSRLIKNLVCKEFNIRETSTDTWLSFDELNNEETYDLAKLKPRYGIGGIDLSKTTDLTCATVIFKVSDDEKIYVKQMYWLPEDILEDRAAEDKIPYPTWKEQGLLRTSQGNKVDYHDILDWFIEIQNEYDIYLFSGGYDSWSATYLINELKQNFGDETFTPVIQGMKTLSSPMKDLGADLISKKINYNNNPILKWCLSNTVTEMDKNGNIQPHKGKNQRKRIDGLASLLDAYVIYENKQAEYESII
ncbi:terminase large subunit [Liquorilactobacillus mali]|uniref:Terminase n=1 Tax=Liquorilactobacillus mali TaxID=1618 RepID=A0A0R2FVG4_9LACO|nr:terminase TerL endonuclease subunit [Liquorilactobacillus mali]KRN31627.1 terminase [Liquorilactobacillus mali]MDN7145156.1 terminase large subunit [Liquorilactobacillus mali]